MGSLDKRIDNLERRMGSPQPVVIVLMEDGPPGREREEAVEVGRFRVYPTGEPPRIEPPEQGEPWGA